MKKSLILFLSVVFLSGCFSGSSNNSNDDGIIYKFTVQPNYVAKNKQNKIKLLFETDSEKTDYCMLSYLDNKLNVKNGDEISVNLSGDTKFTLQCFDKFGNGENKYDIVYIATKPVIKSFKAYPSVIKTPAPHPVKLTWELEKHSYPVPDCYINENNLKDETEENTEIINNARSGDVFTLTCINPAGSDTKQIEISSSLLTTLSPGKLVTKEGGTFNFGDVTLIIPENAVNKDINLNVVYVSTELTGNFLHTPFKIIPDNLTFNTPITVNVKYNPNDLELGGHKLKNNEISALEIKDNKIFSKNTFYPEENKSKSLNPNSVTFKTDKASTFAVAHDNPQPPFDKKIVDLIKTEEIAFFNPNEQITYIDDNTTDYEKTTSSFSEYYKNNRDVIVDDFNLDGKDEIAVLRTFNNKWEVITYELSNGQIINNSLIERKFYPDNDSFHFEYVTGDITSADTDGDGKKELIIVSKYNTAIIEKTKPKLFYKISSDLQIFIYSFDENRGWILKSSNKFENSTKSYTTGSKTILTRVTAADTNHDGIDEIYIINRSVGGKWKLKEYNQGLLINIDVKNSHIINSDTYFADIDSGNFDNDANEELVLVSYAGQSMNVEVLRDSKAKKPYQIQFKKYYDFSDNNKTIDKVIYNEDDGYFFSLVEEYIHQSRFPTYFIPIATADFNFDKIDEIIVPSVNQWHRYVPMLISINNNNLPFEDRFVGQSVMVNNNYEEGEEGGGNGVLGGTYYKRLFFTAADINSDGFDELITIQSDEENVYGAVMQCSLSQSKDYKGYRFKTIFRKKLGKAFMSNDLSHLPVVASGDFDKDNIKLRYTGKYEVNTIDPVIIVAVAAPPTWDNESIQEELHKSETTYGTLVSSGRSETHEVGFSFGLSFGIKVESPVWDFVEGSAKYDWTTTQVTSNTTKKIISYGTSYSADYGHDYVVFTTPTYDSYLYEVLSHPKINDISVHSDGKRYLTINVPKEALIYKWEKDYFEENSKTKIDENLFKHNIGNPFSYPTDAEKNTILNNNKNNCDDTTGECNFESPDYTPVGEGSSITKTEISFETESVKENITSNEHSLEVEICVAGICGGAHEAMENKDIYEISAGKEMQFEGQIADIAEEFYKDYNYMYKLFVYFNKDETNSQKYLVINYAVEKN